MPMLPRCTRPGIAVTALLWLLAVPCLAVVIDTGDGTGNATPPADDFGFENVGVTSTYTSGVYLGDGWVLTANHVGGKPIAFLGVDYTVVPATGVRLVNPLGGTAPDLYLYRINNYPNLSSLELSSATPSVGEEVHCAGNSWNREATLTTWEVSASGWTVDPGCVPDPKEGTVCRDGYQKGSGRTPRWGRNEVTSTGQDVSLGSASTTRSFLVDFDQSGGSDDEFQLVVGDSGGGCWAKRSGTWELVGIAFAMAPIDGNQPGNTAVFGQQSVVADVFYYRDQIEALTPTPVPALRPAGAAVLAVALLAATRLRAAARPARRRRR